MTAQYWIDMIIYGMVFACGMALLAAWMDT